MIKKIVKDKLLLSQKSSKASKEDLNIVEDLLDTIKANKDKCVGMAANMIGYNKQIIVIENDGEYLVMINPLITKATGKYETNEGCLCHETLMPALRYHKITVEYLDLNFKKKTRTFKDYLAQIIQHEIDHCNGILV